MKTKKIMLITALLMLALAPLVLADEYALYCLQEGEFLDLPSLCNPAMEPRTGPINICMKIQDNGKICPANLNVCNSQGLSCSTPTGNHTIDQTPPNMTIYSPIEGEIYSERAVLLDVDPSEISSIYYIDNNDNRGRWTQVCTRCSRYTRARTFTEGFNDITFRVKDLSGNEAYFNLTFYIDSKDPRIKSTLPKNGFASGHFEVEFDEESPAELIIFYGNLDVGMREHNIDLNECVTDRNTLCMIEINLADYDGQKIDYHAELTDIAGSMDSSRPISLDVDYSAPIINSLVYDIDGKKVTFTIQIDEPYLDEVTYIDHNDQRPREKKLCSKLVNEECVKTINFKDGEHNVTITVYDQAGNTASQSIQFFTDSKKPKISKTEPKKGFASGEFYVEFQEDNPQTLTLFYGTDEDEREQMVDLENDCFEDRNKQKCSTDVNLEDYDGQKIGYWFELTDRVGQQASSKIIFLEVDTTFPIINLINYTVDRNRANILLNITESNFDEALYTNNDDRNPRQKRFCSRLLNGMCSKRILLNEGTNNIDLQVIDEAGNSVAQSIEIVL